MNCKLCRSEDTIRSVLDCPDVVWWTCQSCRSQSAEVEYDPKMYENFLNEEIIAASGGIELRRKNCRVNAEWMDRHHDSRVEKTFLDVGCGDGAMLNVMAERGWAVHGFDVARPHYFGPHITIAGVFNRWLFPRRYGAVNCREVIEHVPWPQLLLHELHGCCLPGGLVQVQTPAPRETYHGIIHAPGHLFVASPMKLKDMLKSAHLEVIDELHWGDDTRPNGQAYICRAGR